MKHMARTAQAAGTVPEWQPTIDDLASWAKVLMNDAYMLRTRQRCSSDDFAEGFLGALVALRWRPAFDKLNDLQAFPGRKLPLPGIVEVFVDAGPGLLPELPADLIPSGTPGNVVDGPDGEEAP